MAVHWVGMCPRAWRNAVCACSLVPRRREYWRDCCHGKFALPQLISTIVSQAMLVKLRSGCVQVYERCPTGRSNNDNGAESNGHPACTVQAQMQRTAELAQTPRKPSKVLTDINADNHGHTDGIYAATMNAVWPTFLDGASRALYNS